jgi:hypothetical protein
MQTKLQFYLLFCMDMKLGLSLIKQYTLSIFKNWIPKRIFRHKRGSRRMLEKIAQGVYKVPIYFSENVRYLVILMLYNIILIFCCRIP